MSIVKITTISGLIIANLLVFHSPNTANAKEESANKKIKSYLIKKAGGMSIESYCKFITMNVQEQSFSHFNHANYFECHYLVQEKKGMYENPSRWTSNFNSELDRAIEDWGSTASVIDKIFNEANKVQKLREYYLKKSSDTFNSDGGLNFDTHCRLSAQGRLVEDIELKNESESMSVLIKKCKDLYLPSQKEALGKNKAAMLGAIDTFIIYKHFDTEMKIDQLLKGDVSSYKAP